MNTSSSAASITAAALEERFGRRVTARLSAGNSELSHEVDERLRVARMQAVARRKSAPRVGMAPVNLSRGGAAILGGTWWTRFGSIIPLVALVAGLVAISVMQDDNRADELAAIDSALLTDALPPAAYMDPGFVQFLKTSDAASGR